MYVIEAVSLIFYAYALVVLVILIYEERDPSTTLAWAMALILFPIGGVVLYLIFGRNWRRIGRRDRRRLEAERLGDVVMEPRYREWGEQAHQLVAQKPGFIRRVSAAITAQNKTAPLPCWDLTLLTDGAHKFDALLEDVAGARTSIHLEYFIWESDELTGRFCDLLSQKVAQGVEVRVLYDWLGSMPYPKRQLADLRRAGASVRADEANWSKLNYRNHRKIAVIDGQIAYTGGMNMGREYADGKPRFASWRDTHLRFRGPLVADLQRLFAERWFRNTGESLFGDSYYPPVEPQAGREMVWGQLAYSGPESRWAALRNAFLLAILSAEKDVRIQSPYYIPDEAIQEALVTQSLAGVDVRFMMTGVPDKRVAWNAAFSYLDELVGGGATCLQYDAGFFHCKAMTIDGQLAVFGTTNFDIRSFMLHDELSLFFFDEGLCAQQDAAFEVDAHSCHEVCLATYEQFSPLGKFGNAVARLWSRLL